MTSRRQFICSTGQLGLAAACAGLGGSRLAVADTTGKRAGIQLYTVKDAMAANPADTLRQLRRMGFTEVESAGFGKLSARQFRGLLDEAGLACPSAHLSFNPADPGQALDDAKAIGAQYSVSPIMHSLVAGPEPTADPMKNGMTIDEARRTAALANRLGARAREAGLQFVYHNHAFEFAASHGGEIGYDVLLRETDPSLVSFEIDCGWMVFAGHDPATYLSKYPGRFPMIHVKDFLAHTPDNTQMQGAELGRGTIDYRPIFAAAERAGLRHYFVEQEGPFARMSPLEAAQVDFNYLRSIGRA
jgi:sugar phosphate isomerase/epimerase